MKKVILFFLILCCPLYELQAQSYNTKPGFIIQPTGDTLHGWIRDRADMSKRLSFMPEGISEFIDYLPQDIPAFYVEGGSFYQSKSVDSLQLFLLTLAQGHMSLYQNSTVFYLEKRGDILRKLEKKDSTINSYYKEDKNYIGIILFLFSECEVLKRSRIEQTDFTPSSLIKLVKEYNDCIEPTKKNTTFRGATILKFKPGIKFGALSNDLNYLSAQGTFYGNNFERNIGISGGIFINVTKNDKFSMQLEALITKKGGNLSFNKDTSALAYNDATFSMTYLQFPLSFYYTLATPKISPFFTAGGVYGYGLSIKASGTLEDNKTAIPINKDEVGFRIGTGVTWKGIKHLQLQME